MSRFWISEARDAVSSDALCDHQTAVFIIIEVLRDHADKTLAKPQQRPPVAIDFLDVLLDVFGGSDDRTCDQIQCAVPGIRIAPVDIHSTLGAWSR